MVKFSLYITNATNLEYLKKSLHSIRKFEKLNDILIIVNKSNNDIFKNSENLIQEFKNKDISIKFMENNSNKYSYIDECKNNIVYQLESGNLVSKKTIKFLNNEKNLQYMKHDELYIPFSIKLFKNYSKFESILDPNKNIKFLDRNLIMDIHSVVQEITSRVGRFKTRSLKSIIGNGNFIFFKESFLNYCKEEFSSKKNSFDSYEIFLVYLFLKNNSKIVFNKNISHYQKLNNINLQDEEYLEIKQDSVNYINEIVNINSESSKFIRPQRYYFLTYGTKNFRVAKGHILKVANRSGLFEKCFGCDSSSLSKDFKNEFEDILNLNRGAGYWIWKHEIISSLLNRINENDILVYSDAGSSFNYFAKNRFEEYIEMLNESDFGNFRLECESIHKEKDWTTKELFNYFEIDPYSKIGASTQLEATHMIFKKNDHTLDYFEKYRQVLKEDPYLITDKYNSNNQIEGFKENRHDQSIFSLLTKKYGGVVIENETEFKSSLQNQFGAPFLAVRKHGHGVKDTLKFLTNYKGINEQPVYFN